jgi:hypothetical protein
MTTQVNRRATTWLWHVAAVVLVLSMLTLFGVVAWDITRGAL